MDITPRVPADRMLIQSYGGDGFRISGSCYHGSVLVTANAVLPWRVAASDELLAGDAAEIVKRLFGQIKTIDQHVNTVLLGCGETTAMLPSALRQAMRARGFVVDAMTTAAACRTYNVLVAEDRPVLAALIAVA